MTSQQRGRGYLVVTDRITGRVLDEHDTLRCAHCGSIMRVGPAHAPIGITMGLRCAPCDAFVCTSCSGRGCAPFEARLAKAESRDRLRRSVGVGV
jgi:hypothetical protein